jgi:hypothetical protein
LKYCGIEIHKPVDTSLLEQFNIDKIEHNAIRQHFVLMEVKNESDFKLYMLRIVNHLGSVDLNITQRYDVLLCLGLKMVVLNLQ